MNTAYFYQVETSIFLPDKYYLNLRKILYPMLLAFEPEQKIYAAYGLHKLTLYIVVFNTKIFHINIITDYFV